MKIAFSKKNIWDKTPGKVKKIVGSIVKYIPVCYLLGRRYRRTKEFIEDSQWWSTEKTIEYQILELRRICSLAFERSSYYNKIFSSAGFNKKDLENITDLKMLPVIDKNTIRDNLESMMTVPVWSPNVEYVSTSGTGGMPLRFYSGSNRSSVEYAYLVSMWERAGYKLGNTMAVFRGKIVSEDKSGFRHEYDPILKHHYYSNFHMNDQNMESYLHHMRTIGPFYLHVYPSSVATLARFILRSGVEAPKNILGIIAESENVYVEQRMMVEKIFNCRYFSSYGHTEKLVAAGECEKTRNYHVWPTYGFFELLDENGNEVLTPGEQGEIVGTGFINTVTPFIRYRTGDYAIYIGDRCKECGREQKIISELRGHRIQESLIAYDNSFISWTAVNVHDDTFENVIQFQFYQDTPGYAVLRIVPSEKFNNTDKHRIMVNLSKKFDGRLNFILEIVKNIIPTKGGKAIYVEQRTPGIESNRGGIIV